jgi:uncharacterized protein
MLNKIKDIIIRDKAYAFMLIFIFLAQALLTVSGTGINAPEKISISSVESRQQAAIRQENLAEALKQDKMLVYNLSIIFMLLSGLLLAGAVFLAGYIKDRLKGIEVIPRTLDALAALWSIADVLRVIIIFIFLHNVFSIISFLLSFYAKEISIDTRLDMVLSTLFMDTLLLLFVLRVVHGKYRQGLDTMGLSLKSAFKNICAGAYFYIAFLPVLAIVFLSIVLIAALFHYAPPAQPIYELIFREQRTAVMWTAIFLVALFGPFVEEVFFRGFLYSGLRKTKGVLFSVLSSSFMFALLHNNIIGFIPIMCLGILLAYMREKTGSLVPSIAIHIIHNTALSGLIFFVRGITCNGI